MKRSGGEILVDGLQNLGVERVYCVPGESYLPVLDALYERHSPRVITCRQEGGASYMAEAHGKMTGKLGVCFVSRGPGATNAMIGVHTAFQDSTPMLLFIGQVPTTETYREAFQELDYSLTYQGVAKKVIKIEHVRRIPELLNHAWQVAIQGRPGPVVVVLPEDILFDESEVADMLTSINYAPAPSDQAIHAVIACLQQAKNPLMLLGGASWTAETNYLAKACAEKFSLPVVTTFRRNDQFDNSHPHYCGELGINSNPDLIERVKQADCLLVVGPRLGDITTSGYRILDPKTFNLKSNAQKLIHIHAGGEELGSVFTADIALHCSPREFFKVMNNDSRSLDNLDNAADIQNGHHSYLQYLTRPRNEQSELRMDLVMAYLRQHLPDDSVITVGAGNYATWVQQHYQFTHPETYLGSTNGSMGYGFPAAVTAKLSKPNSLVICFAGDGCFLMNGQELATAVQYELAIIILVINNHCYGTIRTHQQTHYPDRQVATQLRNPDFVALAKAYGGQGYKVNQTHQFADTFSEALQWAESQKRPALIELQVDY